MKLKTDTSVKIRIDPELSALIPAPSDQELALLEATLLEEGCRNPIVLATLAIGGDHILIDGHTRHRLCRKHGIRFETKELQFKDRDAVVVWMLRNQLGRRNCSRDTMAYLRGRLFNATKGARAATM